MNNQHNLEEISTKLINDGTFLYQTSLNKYNFKFEERWLYQRILGIVKIFKGKKDLGTFIFRPKQEIYTEDGEYTYPHFGIGGHAQLNPYNYGSAILVNESYRRKKVGSALLSLGLSLSRKMCESEKKPHYFTIGEVNPHAIDFFNNFGFTITPGIIISGEFNTSKIKIPEIKLN